MFIGFSNTLIGIYSDQKLLFMRQHHRKFEGSRIVNFEKICLDPRSEDIFKFFKSSYSTLVPIILRYYEQSSSYQRFCPMYFLDFFSKMGKSTQDKTLITQWLFIISQYDGYQRWLATLEEFKYVLRSWIEAYFFKIHYSCCRMNKSFWSE